MLPPISSIAMRRRQVVLFCRDHKAFGRFKPSNTANGSSCWRAYFSMFSMPSNNPYIRCYRNISATKRFVSHGDRPESKIRERGARPLYFQRPSLAIPPTHHNRSSTNHPKPQQSLPMTPYEFSGTASVLPPNARHLSPCLGAALAVSPLAGNLMRLGQRQTHDFSVGLATDNQLDNITRNHAESDTSIDRRWSVLLSRIGFLANNLFFQLIRESPIHMVRNKSMPAVHLTPGMIGCLLAHHHQSSLSSPSSLEKPKITRSSHQGGRSKGKGGNRSKEDSNAIIKEALKREFGIKSNRIYDTQWTGISLARWMDLVIPNDHGSEKNGDVLNEACQQSLVSALWLIALWGINPSKEALSNYYEALERVGIVPYSDQQQQGGKYQTDAFTENDFDPTQLEAAMNRLLGHYGRPFRSPNESDAKNEDDASIARAFELVCASIVLQQQQAVVSLPPVVPNGYFAFDGGETKADCAEVVVREILTFLLWDENSSKMEISRLPATTSRDLKAFVHKLNELKGRKANTDEEAQKHQQEELGQIWFDLLSDLAHCDYLAESPNGKAFELAPTSESISKALWHLLVGDEEETIGGQPWTSLQDLANFWSEQNQHQQQQSKVLVVKHDRLKHQSDNGDGDPIFIEHELLSLHLRDNSRIMELRLRCDFQKASGMAAVTHLTKPRQERLIDSRQVQKLQEICFRRNCHHRKDEGKTGKAMARARVDPSLMMLCLALQSEYESSLLPLPEDDSSLAFESLLWLATPYGADRRELMAIGGGGGGGGYPSDCDRKILTRSRLLLKERILHACRVCEIYPRSGAHLLSWILQESPIVVETSSLMSGNRQEDDDSDILDDVAIEQALLSLPTSVLDNDSVLEAIEWNWACFRRGRVLTRAMRWKHRKLSAWQIFAQSKFHELAEVVILSRSIGRRE